VPPTWRPIWSRIARASRWNAASVSSTLTRTLPSGASGTSVDTRAPRAPARRRPPRTGARRCGSHGAPRTACPGTPRGCRWRRRTGRPRDRPAPRLPARGMPPRGPEGTAAGPPGLPGPSPRSRPPLPSRAARPEDLPGHGPIVELQHLVPHYLVGLVPLPRDHHHVARARQRQGPFDGPAAVGDALVAPRDRPLLDLPDDGDRVLAAGVVGGEDGEIRQLRPDAPHDGTLGPVPLPAAPEDHDPPPGGDVRGEPEDLLQAVGRVGVVHDDREVLTLVHRLEPSRDPGDRLQYLPHELRGDPLGEPHREGGEGVADVEPAREGKGHRQAPPGPDRDELAAPREEPEVLGPHRGLGLDPVGPHRGPAPDAHRLRARVVGVDDAH